MSTLSYSFHLGSNKNRTSYGNNSAKSNVSKSTSLSNNGIQNAKTLGKVDNHNYRKYDDNNKDIKIIKGTSNLYKDVQDLYKKEFDQARLEYNSNQTRNDRKIDNYFNHISNSSSKDLACEIIIELGDKSFWDTKDNKFKRKMTEVYKDQVDDLEKLMPNFKIASAVIHYDETSPHMHIVGVPIKEKNKNGMAKQVGKSDVFTKEVLTFLQDKLRVLCIKSFNKVYDLDYSLKEKEKGRNRDIHVKDMKFYKELKEEINKHEKKINELKEETKKVRNTNRDMTDLIKDLKPTLINKNNYIISKEQKDKIISYINNNNLLNDKYFELKNLSVSLKDASEKVKKLENKNKYLTRKNNELKDDLEYQTDLCNQYREENKELNKTIFNLKNTVEYLKLRIERFITFIKEHINFRSRFDLNNSLYEKNVITKEEKLDIKKSIDRDMEYTYKNNNRNKEQEYERF